MSSEHFNGLSPAEAERIAVLLEECAEVVQICGKILRHGYESYHPDDPSRKTNRKLLEKELGDVKFIIEFMDEESDISGFKVEEFKLLKNLKIGKYLHHQEQP